MKAYDFLLKTLSFDGDATSASRAKLNRKTIQYFLDNEGVCVLPATPHWKYLISGNASYRPGGTWTLANGTEGQGIKIDDAIEMQERTTLTSSGIARICVGTGATHNIIQIKDNNSDRVRVSNLALDGNRMASTTTYNQGNGIFIDRLGGTASKDDSTRNFYSPTVVGGQIQEVSYHLQNLTMYRCGNTGIYMRGDGTGTPLITHAIWNNVLSWQCGRGFYIHDVTDCTLPGLNMTAADNRNTGIEIGTIGNCVISGKAYVNGDGGPTERVNGYGVKATLANRVIWNIECQDNMLDGLYIISGYENMINGTFDNNGGFWNMVGMSAENQTGFSGYDAAGVRLGPDVHDTGFFAQFDNFRGGTSARQHYAVWQSSENTASGVYKPKSTYGSVTAVNQTVGKVHDYLKTAPHLWVRGSDTTPTGGRIQTLTFALGDETTAVTTGQKIAVRLPYGFIATEYRLSATTASSSDSPTVDVKKNGTTVFSTLLTLDVSEKTSKTAATAAVITGSQTVWADDDELTAHVTVAGTGTTGLKLTVIGVPS